MLNRRKNIKNDIAFKQEAFNRMILSQGITNSKNNAKNSDDTETELPHAKRLVYISHPSSGLEENTKDIEKIIRKLYAEDDIFEEYCFVSPVHNYGFMYHDVEYDRGLAYCTDLMYFCDEVWVFGDWKTSKGCRTEVDISLKLGIKLRFLGNSDELDNVIKNKLYKLDSYIETPSKNRDIVRNKKVFVCVSEKWFDRHKYSLTEALSTKLMYENINDALNKIKDKASGKHYLVLEVEIKCNSILDLNDEVTAEAFRKYVESSGTEEVDELKLNLFAYVQDKQVIKRFIPGKTVINKIQLGGKTVYRVVDSNVISQIKVYNNYIITDGDNSGKSFTFSNPFNY